jgi:hypothetical protein
LLLENNFNFNVKLNSMKWKKVTQWKSIGHGAWSKENHESTKKKRFTTEPRSTQRRKFFLLPLSRRQEESFAALRAFDWNRVMGRRKARNAAKAGKVSYSLLGICYLEEKRR